MKKYMLPVLFLVIISRIASAQQHHPGGIILNDSAYTAYRVYVAPDVFAGYKYKTYVSLRKNTPDVERRYYTYVFQDRGYTVKIPVNNVLSSFQL